MYFIDKKRQIKKTWAIKNVFMIHNPVYYVYSLIHHFIFCETILNILDLICFIHSAIHFNFCFIFRKCTHAPNLKGQIVLQQN